MFRIVTRQTLCLAALAALILASPARAQQAAPAAQPTVSAALAADAGMLADKFTGLAGAMAGRYDWRPMADVRSVGDVFNLIVMENKMLMGLLTGAAAPAGARPSPITDATEMQKALKSSYAALQQALAALSDADLKAPVKFFGRDTTKQGAAFMLLFDQHEHLGQSIAYARSNSVVPPWSVKK